MILLTLFGTGGIYLALDAILFKFNVTKFTSKWMIAPTWRFLGWIILFLAVIFLVIGFKIAFSFKPDSKEISDKTKENLYKMIK